MMQPLFQNHRAIRAAGALSDVQLSMLAATQPVDDYLISQGPGTPPGALDAINPFGASWDDYTARLNQYNAAVTRRALRNDANSGYAAYVAAHGSAATAASAATPSPAPAPVPSVWQRPAVKYGLATAGVVAVGALGVRLFGGRQGRGR